MNSSNQIKSDYSTVYNSNVALEVFKLFGKLELAKAGKKLFVQGQKASFLSFLQTDKTYLLVEGKVTIQTASGRVIDIEPGEIFGEFTLYTTSNTTAIANIPCKLLSLSKKQLIASLKKKPAFLFMLMDALIKSSEIANFEAKDSPSLTENINTKKDTVLSARMLSYLKQKLGDTALMAVPEKRVIFQKGAAALLMYVILEGQMAIIIDNTVVGRSGPGDVVGEIALLARQHSRTASVVTESRCVLLAINRQALVQLVQTLPTFGISLLRILASHLHPHHPISK